MAVESEDPTAVLSGSRLGLVAFFDVPRPWMAPRAGDQDCDHLLAVVAGDRIVVNDDLEFPLTAITATGEFSYRPPYLILEGLKPFFLRLSSNKLSRKARVHQSETVHDIFFLAAREMPQTKLFLISLVESPWNPDCQRSKKPPC